MYLFIYKATTPIIKLFILCFIYFFLLFLYLICNSKKTPTSNIPIIIQILLFIFSSIVFTSPFLCIFIILANIIQVTGTHIKLSSTIKKLYIYSLIVIYFFILQTNIIINIIIIIIAPPINLFILLSLLLNINNRIKLLLNIYYYILYNKQYNYIHKKSLH